MLGQFKKYISRSVLGQFKKYKSKEKSSFGGDFSWAEVIALKTEL